MNCMVKKNLRIKISLKIFLVKRFSNTVIKHDCKIKGKSTKIKMLVKNTDNGSKALQDYLLKEGGSLIIESCQKFLQDVEK